jgi:hypothetical protein
VETQTQTEVERYPEIQERAEEEAFNSSTISIVLVLMPQDNHPTGRLGLISIRNDTDPPLFSLPLRGEELAELLQAPPLARLIAELNVVLPQRFKEREAKAREQTVAQPASTTSFKGDKATKHSTQPTAHSSTRSVSLDLKPTVAGTAGIEQSTPTATPTPKPSGETAAVEGKTTQLTLF